MTEFHLDARVLAAYADGGLHDADAWSVEAHLDSCASCRAGIVLDEPTARLVEAAAVALGRRLPPPGRARPASAWRRVRVLLTAAPAARGAWLMAVVVAGLTALGGSVGQATLPPWLLLLVAPTLPVVGTALSYGPRTDPLHELVAGTPHGGLRLVLWRTLAVLTATAPVAVLAGAAAGLGTPAVWPLICLALTALTLALGSMIEPATAAGVVLGVWALVVVAPFGAWTLVLGSGPMWWGVTAAAVAVLYVRREQVGRRAA
ncbi:zf-HC2 domain-containing protein [Micromonospora endophytica]|uniref:Anti-sigma factor n=1 Tax=Micromonospora endophytica TaxID=515350 RepID=A0A2W2DFI7_9ACTN|nr:zf-HC2 domain-containing protein [Micromonospora endophytica]PZF98617.1 anti-sigma factor [Micromonospora endophytica]RIW40766.1 anti-sigma factor [Micromonospora endophytica]BCJ56907.1 hypothetical protein Jiend_03290 [Micromonospora endophytica]